MPTDRMWIIRTLWLVGMVALVGLVVVGFTATMRDPSLIDIPAFTGLFTSLGLSLRALIVIFLVLPAGLSIAAAVWMFLGAKTQWFPLLLGLGLVAQNAYSSGFTTALPPTPGWQTATAYIETAAMTLIVLVVFLFPNGRFVPGWSRWVVLLTIAMLALAPTVAGTWRRMLVSPDRPPPDQLPVLIGFGFAFIFATIAQIIRYRRFATLIERQQARWMVFALSTVVGSALLALVATILLGPDSVVVGLLVTVTAVASVLQPVAAAIAMRRYRLYDLDRVISRTVSFSIVIGLVAMVYTGGVIAVQALIPTAGALAVASSTLAAAAAFAPLLRRVERGVERRFNRARFNGDTELAAFSDRVSNQVGLDALTNDLFEVISHTLQPTATGIWIRSGAGGPLSLRG